MKDLSKILLGFFLLTASAACAKPQYQIATFAGGCFWCMQPPFEKLAGVTRVLAGYTDGDGTQPSYENYAEKGYTEAVQVVYDSTKITYPELLDVFWRQINPTDPDGQFVDRGPQYRAAIIVYNGEQKRLAEKSKTELDQSGRYGKPIVLKILPFKNFFPAEEYHQDFYKKNPIHYKFYRMNAGRDQYIEKIWGKQENHE